MSPDDPLTDSPEKQPYEISGGADEHRRQVSGARFVPGGRPCVVDHKTVKAVVDRAVRGEVDIARQPVVREHNYDAVAAVVRRKVEATNGRISAKRLLPVAVAEGYAGSDRNFRRLVAEAKADYRRHGRILRPWRPAPGESLAIDYGT